MKKNLSLALVLVMVLTALLGVVPMAEASGTTEKYIPQITYSNVNYTDKLTMMFAVPAPAEGALAEGEQVKLLLWEDKEDGVGFTINDSNKLEIAAEAGTVTIGGVAHLVFKYNGLDAGDMTKVIATRPIIHKTTVTTVETKNDAGEVTGTTTETTYSATAYGALIEYSVLEYVVSAKGGFDGIAGLTDAAALARIDELVAFGGLVQRLSDKDAEFYIDSEVAKINVIPVTNGAVGATKIFGGFKNAAAGTVTISAPFVDGKELLGYAYADGSAITDADGIISNGIQIEAPAGDLEIRAIYEATVMKKTDIGSVTTAGGGIDSIMKASGNSFSLGIGGLTISLGAASGEQKAYGYSALFAVADPYNNGEFTYRVTCGTSSNVMLGETANDWKVSVAPFKVPGFGETIDSAVVVDFTVGRAGEKFVRTGDIYLRGNSTSNRTGIGYFEEDGTFKMYNGYNEDGTNATTTLDVAVAATGYTRYVFVVDFENEVIKAYAAADANGELVYQGETTQPKLATGHMDKAWSVWAKTLDRLEIWTAAQNLTEEEMQLKADLDGDGVREAAMVVDGTPNKEAVKAIQTELHSFYIKSVSTYVGNPFK